MGTKLEKRIEQQQVYKYRPAAFRDHLHDNELDISDPLNRQIQENLTQASFPELADKDPNQLDISQAPRGAIGGRQLRYLTGNTSYSGADIRAIAHIAGNASQSNFKVFAELQTLSYSVHRDKVPVRVLGRTYPKAYVRGPRTVAGSMVFTVFDKHALWEIMQYYIKDPADNIMQLPMADMLPPFDITVTFANEYGHQSVMRIYGIDLIDEGQTMSIEDMITENVMSYVARHIEVMTATDKMFDDKGNLKATRPGDVIFNRGIFTSNVLGRQELEWQSFLLDKISSLQLELVREIPEMLSSPNPQIQAEAVSREKRIREQITFLRSKLEGGFNQALYVQRRANDDSSSFYNIPWHYRNIRTEDNISTIEDTLRKPRYTEGSPYELGE